MGSKRIILAVLLVGFIVSESSAQFNRHRRRGTIIGGVAGAAIGAAIGDRRDNEAIGAVIGATTGAVIGGSIGTNKDYRIEQSLQHQSHYKHVQTHQSQAQYIHPYPQQNKIYVAPVVPVTPVGPPVTQQAPISHDDVVAMLQSGLSEQLVALQIQRRGVQYSLGVNDLIRLHQQGVSEGLIDLMQANAVSTATPPVQPAPNAAFYPPQSSQQFVPQNAPQTSPYGASIMAPPVSDYPSGN